MLYYILLVTCNWKYFFCTFSLFIPTWWVLGDHKLTVSPGTTVLHFIAKLYLPKLILKIPLLLPLEFLKFIASVCCEAKYLRVWYSTVWLNTFLYPFLARSICSTDQLGREITLCAQGHDTMNLVNRPSLAFYKNIKINHQLLLQKTNNCVGNIMSSSISFASHLSLTLKWNLPNPQLKQTRERLSLIINSFSTNMAWSCVFTVYHQVYTTSFSS